MNVITRSKSLTYLGRIFAIIPDEYLEPFGNTMVNFITVLWDEEDRNEPNRDELKTLLKDFAKEHGLEDEDWVKGLL